MSGNDGRRPRVVFKDGTVDRFAAMRTAGGGGSGEEQKQNKEDLHVAYIYGVADVEHIRDTIRERLRRCADAGLGDPDDAHGEEATSAALQSLEQSPAAQQPLQMALSDAAPSLAEEAALLRTLRARLTGSSS